MSKKLTQATAAGLRNTRPWLDSSAYPIVMSGPKDSAYYMFLTWEETVNDVADHLHRAIGPKFDRNAFVVAAGVYKFTCKTCYEVVVPDFGSACRCTHSGEQS